MGIRILLYSLLYPRFLNTIPHNRRHSINICWMNEKYCCKYPFLAKVWEKMQSVTFGEVSIIWCHSFRGFFVLQWAIQSRWIHLHLDLLSFYHFHYLPGQCSCWIFHPWPTIVSHFHLPLIDPLSAHVATVGIFKILQVACSLMPLSHCIWGFLSGSVVKNTPAM